MPEKDQVVDGGEVFIKGEVLRATPISLRALAAWWRTVKAPGYYVAFSGSTRWRGLG